MLLHMELIVFKTFHDLKSDQIINYFTRVKNGENAQKPQPRINCNVTICNLAIHK